ncbi:hypothetical protein AB0C18_35830 [Nonomuraea muscovyensis]|uniref:hypothetical protein n=1 Tax=Nonomuraea muscovyensis TaxID=1124761 RepID=UPI0033C9AF6A
MAVVYSDPASWAVAVYLAAGCGLRGGEIFGLELDQIDLKRREVDTSQQLVCVSGRKPYLAPVKTETSTRTIELPDLLCAAPDAHLKRFGAVENEIDDETDLPRPSRRVAKLLIATNMLQPVHRAIDDGSNMWAPVRRDPRPGPVSTACGTTSPRC